MIAPTRRNVVDAVPYILFEVFFMPKIITPQEAAALIPSGATVMFGGFMGCGSAHKFIDALSKSGVKDLTMICNDASMPGGPMGEDYYATAKLVHNKQIKRLIATHVGLNPEVAPRTWWTALWRSF